MKSIGFVEDTTVIALRGDDDNDRTLKVLTYWNCRFDSFGLLACRPCRLLLGGIGCCRCCWKLPDGRIQINVRTVSTNIRLLRKDLLRILTCGTWHRVRWNASAAATTTVTIINNPNVANQTVLTELAINSFGMSPTDSPLTFLQQKQHKPQMLEICHQYRGTTEGGSMLQK